MTQANTERVVSHDSALHDACQALADAGAMCERIAAMAKLLCRDTGFDGLAAMHADDDGQLHVYGGAGMVHKPGRGGWLPGQGLPGRVFLTGQPIVLDDARAAEELAAAPMVFAASPDGGDRLLTVPMRHDGLVVGALVALRRNIVPGTPVVADLRLLATVALLVAQTCCLCRLAQELEQGGEIDPLLVLPQRMRQRFEAPGVIGQSRAMQRVLAEIRQAAPTNVNVLLRGESGTGKEAMAQALHRMSRRAERVFVKVNCAALTESLLESELFGHERGAFTGAISERKGRFELADGGTLFLDEIGDISPAFQAKLLRVLQEHEFERVGGNRPIKVDVRLIFATNQPLEAMVRDGSFRADLYYRVNVVPIMLPPLRERRDDIPLLVEHFLARYNADNGTQLQITRAAVETLTSCCWPGNVRELQNCLERAAVMSRDSVIRDIRMQCNHEPDCHDGGPALGAASVPVAAPVADAVANAANAAMANAAVDPADLVGLPDTPRERLIAAMERSGWVQAKAARLLGLSPRQLGYALLKHGIEIRRL